MNLGRKFIVKYKEKNYVNYFAGRKTVRQRCNKCFAFARSHFGNSPLMQHDAFPHAAVAPFVLAAGTDARWLCDVCPCTLRFAPIDIDNQQFNSVHSVDENIDLAAIGEAIEFYKEVIGNYK